MANQAIFWLVFLVLIGALFYWLGPVLTPFLLAAFLAYLGNPLCKWLESHKIGRTLAVVLVFLGLFLLVTAFMLWVIPLIIEQITKLINNLSDYLAWLGRYAQKLHLDWHIEQIKSVISKNLGEISALFKKIISVSGGPIDALISWFSYLLLIPVVTFYLLRDWDMFLAKIKILIPSKSRPTVLLLASKIDNVLSGFIRGQLLVMLLLGFLYSAGLMLIGLNSAILIGVFAGLVSFVPYLGLIVGLVGASLVALIQFQDWVHLLMVLGVFGVVQILESTLITPKLVGERIGLHPVAVLFAVLAGGQLFGFLGVLLALPVAAVINVLLGYCKECYLKQLN